MSQYQFLYKLIYPSIWIFGANEQDYSEVSAYINSGDLLNVEYLVNTPVSELLPVTDSLLIDENMDGHDSRMYEVLNYKVYWIVKSQIKQYKRIHQVMMLWVNILITNCDILNKVGIFEWWYGSKFNW